VPHCRIQRRNAFSAGVKLRMPSLEALEKGSSSALVSSVARTHSVTDDASAGSSSQHSSESGNSPQWKTLRLRCDARISFWSPFRDYRLGKGLKCNVHERLGRWRCAQKTNVNLFLPAPEAVSIRNLVCRNSVFSLRLFLYEQILLASRFLKADRSLPNR